MSNAGKKRSLYKAGLSEPSFQEQGVHELVKAALQGGELGPIRQLLLQPPPPKASIALCAAVCRGLLHLMLKDRVDPHEAVRWLIEATEVALAEDDNPAQAFGAKVALISPVSPYLALYASSVTKLVLLAVAKGGPDAALEWAAQPPLIVALGLHATKMASAVLEEAAFNRLAALPPSPKVTMPALSCPVICSIVFQPELASLRHQLLHCLALLPFEYLPEEAVHALALSWVHLLPFFPSQTTEDLVVLTDWAKLIFRAFCYLETMAMVEQVGKPLATFIVKQALDHLQGMGLGNVQAPQLALLVLLERISDYCPSLVANHLGLIAYLTDLSPPGDERSTLLNVLSICAAAPEEVVGRPWLRWAIGPLLSLVGREEAVKGSLLNTFLAPIGSTEPDGGLWTRPATTSLLSLEREIPRLTSNGCGPLSRRWAYFVASARLLEGDEETRQRALRAMEQLLEAEPLIGTRVLPLLLHLLNQWKGQGQLQLRLLDCLVPLGCHQLGTMLVQALLRRLPMVDAGSDRLKVVMGTACLRLSTKLFKVNTRTLSKLRQLLLEGSALSDEVDEYRLARIQGIAEVIAENPEAGSEFIGVVQTYLTDELPAITALAVDCITYLCTADCLDYLAAMRILSKKGRVSHKEHPRVMANLADLYGAAVYVFDCSPASIDVDKVEGTSEAAGEGPGDEQEDYGDEEPRPRLSDRHLTILTDNLWGLSLKEQGTVRARAYRALIGFMPTLLASEEEGVAEGVCTRVFAGLKEERDAEAREALGELVSEILRIETNDAATWGRALLKTSQEAAAKPSRKTVKSLPTASEVLTMYRGSQGGAGAAGACLHAISAEPSAVPSLSDVLLDALSDEDGGARCIIQRLVSAQGYLRFLPVLVDHVTKMKERELEPFAAQVAAMEEVQGAIMKELQNPEARNLNNCFLALAGLANSLSPQLSHKVNDLLDPLLSALDSAASSIAVDVPMLELSLGMTGRCLNASHGELVLSLLSRLSEHSSAFATRTDLDWCLWGASVGMGALTDWVRQLYSPDLSALHLLSGVCRACLTIIQERMQSRAVADLLMDRGETTFSVEGMQRAGALGSGPVVLWGDMKPSGGGEGGESEDLRVIGACYGLALVVPNLSHTGLERQAIQIYHVARAAAEAGLPGAEIPLTAAAALGVRANLLESEEVFGTFRMLTARVDQGAPTEGVLLGLANLVVGVQGALTLPAGFVEDVKARMLAVARENTGTQEGGGFGTRIAALFALYTLLGNGGPTCSLLSDSIGGGFSMDRSTASVMAGLVEALRTGLASSSRRFASACARVLGLLAALRMEKPSEGGKQTATKVGMTTSQVDTNTLGMPSEGTLAHMVVQELVQLAVGDLSGAQTASTPGRDFIITVLEALAACSVLRFSHKQVTQLLQNYLKAAPDSDIAEVCMSFAVKSAHRDNTYATWLYDVAVNASRPTVLDVVIGHLGQLVKIIPGALVQHLLGTVWSQLWSRPEGRYSRATKALASLSKALVAQKPETSGTTAAQGVWPFLCKDVWPLGSSGPLARDLVEDVQAEGDGSALAVVDALILVLARFPVDDLLGLVGDSPEEGLFSPLVTCLLVERKVLPLSSLRPVVHRLVGPATGTPSSAVVPFLMRAMVAVDAANVQYNWVLDLLDFLQVQPDNLRPLFLLVHLLHSWYPTYYRMLLEPGVREDWRVARASYLRMVAQQQDPRLLTCDDWVMLDDAMALAVAGLYQRLGAEQEVEVLSRVIKVLGALPKGGGVAAWQEAQAVRATSGQSMAAVLRSCMLGMIEGARRGKALSAGALPSVRVLLSQHAIAIAIQ